MVKVGRMPAYINLGKEKTMSSDVALTAALRNNLLSLQKTQSAIDSTQLHLSTGRKVNSALDGPQAFFAAQALSNRAKDLQGLLDSVGQSIQVIKAADNGVSALTTLIEQATSIATSAREAVASDADSAQVTGDTDVSDFEASSTYANGTLTFTATDKDGLAVTLTGGAINIDDGTTIDTIVNSINDITNADGDQVLEAKLNSSGKLEISSLDGTNFTLTIDGDTTSGTSEDTSAALASELGFGSIARTNGGGNTVSFTAKAASALSSGALYQSDGETLALRSTTLGDLLRENSSSGDIDIDVFDTNESDVNGTDTFSINIGLNGSSTARITVTENTTVQELIDDINNNSVLTGKIEATFDDDTGQLSFKVKDASVESIELGLSVTDDDATNSAATIDADFGFGTAALTATAATDATREDGVTQSIRLGESAGELGQYETDFNRVRDQIDQLVADAGYRGVNLLDGDDLLTVFNEDRTSSLTTTGVDFSADGLGIGEAVFGGTADIDDTLDQVRDALATVRNFGTTLANDLTVIQTRQDFTTNLINTLTEGSDKLTIADQNEEGAKLLALQTRQQLGVTSLSLASQSQQSILRLF